MSKQTTSPQDASPTPPAPRPRRWRRRFAHVLIVLLLLGVVGELFARFYLGLGDPPLSQADPKIEYLFKPDQDCHRFGNRIRYNHYSMRSDDFPAHKADPRELRVLVVGDSVINGGVQTDQSKLATTLLQQRLSADLGRPVVVGNVSAGSWGPPNEQAYLKRFGLFDADVLVIVLSSHDAHDVPTFEPVVGVSPTFPDHRPVLALWEGFERYLLPRFRGPAPTPADPGAPVPGATTAPVKQADVDASLAALREMIRMAKSTRAAVVVAQYPEAAELAAPPKPGYQLIADEARKDGVEPTAIAPAFAAAKARGEDPYRDPIHPNDAGQRIIADVLSDVIKQRLPARP